MRICMVCPELGGSGGNAFIGGHANTVVQLSQVLSDRGHEITIITTPHRYPGNRPDKDILKEWADVYMRLSDNPLNPPQILPPFHESHDFSGKIRIFSPKNPYYPIIPLNLPEFTSLFNTFLDSIR